MRKVILSVVALSIAALVSGCTTSCDAQKPVAHTTTPAPVVVEAAPAPVVVDAKEAAVK